MKLFKRNQYQQPVVATQEGQLAGTISDNITIFKGIPYAAPPIGALRWKAPQPHKRWKGVKDACNFGPSCMQQSSPFTDVPGQELSEDCLYLNIWTPATSHEDNVPVLVWIHGGGFSFGSTAQPIFDGIELAKKGVVFVSIAYRIGPFGFFTHPALSAEAQQHTSGNYGLLDQIAALQWLQNNIAQFGGNPDSVTIMGESAGGISVSMLAASPLAKGLFHRAIAESGASFGYATDNIQDPVNIKTLVAAEQAGKDFADSLGALSADDLRALPAETILEKMPKLSELVLACSWPVFDGYVIADDPVALYQAGQHNDTPILIGTNAAEGALFYQSETRDSYIESVKSRFGDYSGTILQAYPAKDDAEALQSQQNLFRDSVFAWHAWTWAKLQTQYGCGPVYSYYFNHTPPALANGMSFGPTHAAEMAYVFNLLPVERNWTEADKRLAAQISSYWTNFAKTGDPNGEGLPKWPAWQNDKGQVMHFNEQPEVGNVANITQLEAIDGYYARLRK